MAVADPLDTPVPYQCRNHQKCKRRLYSTETFNTLKVLGTRVIGRDSRKIIGEWIIMTCPHCGDTYNLTLSPDLYRLVNFVTIEKPADG